jgi:diguanylate cyclase (GGDEF)-like protein
MPLQSERQAYEMFRQATVDPLTGLVTPALFLDRLQQGIAAVQRTHRRIGVLLIDIDGLTSINDRHGLRAGDATIREIAARIAAEARQSDTVARTTGGEFAYLLCTVPDRAGVRVVAERIAHRSAAPFTFEGERLSLAISVGAAIGPEDGDDVDELMLRAGEALRSVKRLKKSRLP